MPGLLPSAESNTKVFRIPFSYHATQATVANDLARFKVIRCGRKWGKTTLAERKALDALRKPNSVYWHIAPTYRQAKLISWDKFKRLIPPEALGKKPNDTDLIITLKNGSQLYLMGSDNEDSLRGPEPNGVTLEEAAFHKGDVWHKIIRPNLAPKRGSALFITTPKGFNWFKDLEDEAIRRRKMGDSEWAAFHFTIYDNPHISREEIESSRKDCDSEAVWRQEYMAEYEASMGRVFNSFSDSRHVKSIPLPVGRFDCWRAVDWGMRDNTACLWGFIRNGKLCIYREYLANNLSAPAQADIIRNQTTGKENVVLTAISHDAAKEDPAMKGLTVMWHFRQSGLQPLRPSSRDKKHSRAMINQLLQEDRLVIDEIKCPKLRKQMLAYEWKDTTLERVDDTADDDAIDALHYLVEMLQFQLFIGKTKEDNKSMTEIMAEIAREKIAQQTRRLEVPGNRTLDDFSRDFDGSSAGYFQ